MKNNDIRKCKCGCGRTLPDRYKGRLREYATPECRKLHHLGKVNTYVLGQ